MAGELSALSVLSGGKFAEFTVAGQTAASVTADSTKSPTFACTSASDGGTVGRTGIRSRFISATNSGGNAVIRVLLAEPIYDSCSSVTMTMTAGFTTDGSVTSAAASASAVTNNATLTSPLPFAAWWSPPATTYTGVFGDSALENPVGIVAKSPHRIKEVNFTFTQGGTVITETVSTPTLISSARTLVGLAGTWTFKNLVYLPTTSAASFADGAVVVTAEVVPLIGNANRTTSTSATDSFDALTVYANSGGSLTPATLYVGAGGNDSNTGLSWAQRLLTLNKAMEKVDGSVAGLTATERNGAIIEMGPGTWTQASFVGDSGYANDRWVVIKRSAANGATRANTIIQWKAQQHGVKLLKFEDLTLDVTVASELDVWSGAAAGRRFWLHKVYKTTSNASGRDGANVGTFYGSNYSTRPFYTDCVAYDYPDRPFLQGALRRNCTVEKVQIDGCRDCVHTIGDLCYDVYDTPGGSHPDYFQILNAVENFILDGFVALNFDGEPLFMGPAASPMSGWIANGIVVQQTDELYISSVATNAALTIDHLVIANVTSPNSLFNLSNITAPGSITHTNTWYIHNVQRQLSNGNVAGVTSMACHSTNSAVTDDVDYGFTEGDPGFVDGAYNANFDSGAMDYTPATGSALLKRMVSWPIAYDYQGRRVSSDATYSGSIGAIQPAPTIRFTIGAATYADNDTANAVAGSISVDIDLSNYTSGTAMEIVAAQVSGDLSGLSAGTGVTQGTTEVTATFTAAAGTGMLTLTNSAGTEYTLDFNVAAASTASYGRATNTRRRGRMRL